MVEILNMIGLQNKFIYPTILLLNALISFFLFINRVSYNKYIEQIIRERRLAEEIKRYQDTAYITPFVMYYVEALSRIYIFDKDNIKDQKFKKKLALYFKNGMYSNKKWTRLGPRKERNYLMVIGWRIWAELFINIFFPISVLVCALLSLQIGIFPFIPLVTILLIKGIGFVQILKEYHPRNSFGEEKQIVSWKYAKDRYFNKTYINEI